MSDIICTTEVFFIVQQKFVDGEWHDYSYHPFVDGEWHENYSYPPKEYTDLNTAKTHVEKSKDCDKTYFSPFREFRILKCTVNTMNEVVA